MKRKAQSALEYLMSYGWSLVIIVIIIAALVFLVLPPPETVEFSSTEPAKIMVGNGAIENSGNVTVIAQNITGANIKVTGFTLEGDFAGSKLNGAERTSISSSNPLLVKAGNELRFTEIVYTGAGNVNAKIHIEYLDYSDIARSADILAQGKTTASGAIVVSSCPATLNQANKTYVLTSSLGALGNCIAITASNVNLDCGNKNITGNNSSNGIFISGASNVTIANCSTTRFQYGFQISNASNVSLSNNTANRNTGRGFYFTNSTISSFNSNTACCNSHDIYCQEAGVTLPGSNNAANARYQCLANTIGCAQVGIIC